jgi:hypothetical protein
MRLPDNAVLSVIVQQAGGRPNLRPDRTVHDSGETVVAPIVEDYCLMTHQPPKEPESLGVYRLL